ncbi:hypothetical protein QQY24_02940 [Streptomyces sp. TG1A-8]|uniref:hypothetical protein n=1 Tax=Streptomyces sp. TG1A-8 TaxID=3051385 RepID=UPI00265C14B3|nr:hypothetical protein [Streptomyces sp. TG1A-8]MDO0924421.1 hypothetical protein [Streptomyces sp. TG1A-8]
MRPHLPPAAAAVAAAAIGIGVPALAAPAAHAEDTAPDLVVSSLPSATPRPGDVYDRSVTITNEGTAAADRVTFQIRLTRGLDFPEPVPGCTYSTLAGQVRQARCELATAIAPGASVSTPVRFKALPEALLESVEYGTSSTGAAPAAEGYGDSYRRLPLTADSTADLVAIGDRAEGRRGSRVTVRATLRNDGPGWIHNQESDDQPGLMVHIPPGTEAVDVPEECAPFGIDAPTGPSEPGHSTYVCWHDDNTIEVGQSLAYDFVLRIGGHAHDTKGAVTASSVYGIHQAYDENPANDTAYLAVDVTDDHDPGTGTSGGGETDGGSGTGGTGNDPHGQSTGGSGTPAPTPASATAGSDTGGSATGGPAGTPAGGSLAATGSDGTGLVAAGAAGSAALGGLLFAAARRRGARTARR